MTTEYTDHFRLNLPDFRMGPWHDLVNQDFVTIDQLLFSLYQGVDTQIWANATHYMPGTTAIDPDDNSFWVCIVEHTSALTGSFSADRAAHPTYWNRVVVGINPRGEWANSTHYLPNDFVTDSSEHVVAVCITEHTSNASGSIRDDAAYWSFIVDVGSAVAIASNVAYDNTASGTTKTNLQDTTDELYSSAASQQSAIDANTAAVANHGPRISTLETNVANNTSAIAGNTSAISALNTRVTDTETKNTAQDTRLTNVENSNATKITDAPADGTTYARKDHAWIDVLSVAGASVLVSDTPPASPRDGQLWWESDTGQLYIRYNDGDSAQWVVAVPQLDAGSFLSSAVDANQAVRMDIAQTTTTTQREQARQNIYAAPFDAMAYNGMQVNGAFTVSQERGFGNPLAGGAPHYPCDMWWFSRIGTAVLSVSPNAGLVAHPMPNWLVATVTTAQAAMTAGDLVTIFQSAIEGNRIAHLRWGTVYAQPITIGFFSCHHRPGIYSVTLANSGRSRSYATTYTHNAADVVQWNVITIPGDTGGIWLADNGLGMSLQFALASGSNLTTPVNNAWQAGNYQAAIGQVNGVAATSDVFRITGLMVLPGLEAPLAARVPYIMRSADQELRTCKRYWQIVELSITGMTATAAGQSLFSTIPFEVEMRASPVMGTIIAASLSNATIAPSVYNGSRKGLRFDLTATAAGNALAYAGMYSVDARL